jgi:hypothetical protein
MKNEKHVNKFMRGHKMQQATSIINNFKTAAEEEEEEVDDEKSTLF